MCHNAAFGPGFPRKEAMEVTRSFLGIDEECYGWGFAYAKDGDLIVTKVISSEKNDNLFTDSQKKEILAHMPYASSWTCSQFKEHSIHRKAKGKDPWSNMKCWTNGPEDNCHPWREGDWALSQMYGCNYDDKKIPGFHRDGCVDSEGAARALGLMGPDWFFKNHTGGQDSAVNVNGSILVVGMTLFEYKGALGLTVCGPNLDGAKVLELFTGTIDVDGTLHRRGLEVKAGADRW